MKKLPPEAERQIAEIHAKMRAWEADTAGHEAKRKQVEAYRPDPSEAIATMMLRAALELTLPHNDDKVTSQSIANEIKKKGMTPHDEIGLSMFRMKLNIAFDILGID